MRTRPVPRPFVRRDHVSGVPAGDTDGARSPATCREPLVHSTGLLVFAHVQAIEEPGCKAARPVRLPASAPVRCFD